MDSSFLLRLPPILLAEGVTFKGSSVDVTERGIDKAYGIRQLAELTGIGLDDMLFVGGRLDEHGNDYPVLAMGVRCHAVGAGRTRLRSRRT